MISLNNWMNIMMNSWMWIINECLLIYLKIMFIAIIYLIGNYDIVRESLYNK
jgi:hypothetical protein